MKKIYSVLSVLLTIILMGVFVSCERDKEVMLTAVSITNEQITPMYKSATISSTISSEATIRDVFVQYTVTKDFAEYDEVPMQEKDGIYTAELIDLLDNTTYYYRYAASNRHSAIVLQKIQQFTTLQPTAPVIRLDSILTVWDSYAQVQVALEFDGGASVTDMGVCWGTQANPTIEDIHKSTKDTVAVLDIPSLQPNTQYYVRAYAVNKVGVAYSEEKTFTTSSEIALPTVTTATVTQITETTAVAGGNVTSDGGASVTERGVVYATTQNPTTADNKVSNGSGTGSFTCNLSNLQAGTTYYVRAYAINNKGTAYGDEVSFTTALPISLATVTTASITNITETTAKAGGTVTNDGNASVTERGVCIATVSNPTTSNTKITAGSGTGSFTCNLTGLQANTTYYVRAYAVNSKGTAYGEQVSFTTQQQSNTPPTDDAIIFDADIDQGNASTDTNNAAAYQITKSGVTMEVSSGVIGIYNNEAHYRIFKSQTLTLTSTVGNIVKVEFTCTATDDTKYGPGCFTVDGGEYAYSGAVGTWTGAADAITFTASTNQVRATQVAVTIIDNGTENGTENGYAYVDLGLSVKWATMNVGVSKAEEYGDYFAWGETQPKSTYDWSMYKYCNGSSSTLTKYCNMSSYGNNGFTDNKTQLDLSDDAARVNWGGAWRMPTDAEWTELREQCTWTWTTQNGKNGYKVTSKKSGYTNNSIFLPAAGYRYGSSLDDAGSYGYYWSSSLNTVFPYNAYRLTFYSSYVGWRNYDRQSGQSVRPVLGENKVAETTAPTITTTSVTQITESSAVAGGNVTSDGGESVTERGVVYSTKPNPVITNLSNTIRPCGSGTGVFTYTIYGLQSGTTYYVRAYAKNDAGTAYGEEVSFTTKEEMVDNPPSNLVAMPFSVSAGKQVTFSQGNLQYTQSTNTWSFAENQYDYIGTDNVTGGSVSSDPTYGLFSTSGAALADKIDLFGWSTSATNFGVSTSTDWESDYFGSFVDWGTNKIDNDAPNTWRTLTYGEWYYLRYTRTNADALCGVAQVNGVNGLVLLPDNWTCPEGVTFKSGFHSNHGVDYYAALQTFTADQWSKLESAGAVFLPAAGYRIGTNVGNVQYDGYYWSATEYDSDGAYYLYFRSVMSCMSGSNRRSLGHSVRLVKDL